MPIATLALPSPQPLRLLLVTQPTAPLLTSQQRPPSRTHTADGCMKHKPRRQCHCAKVDDMAIPGLLDVHHIPHRGHMYAVHHTAPQPPLIRWLVPNLPSANAVACFLSSPGLAKQSRCPTTRTRIDICCKPASCQLPPTDKILVDGQLRETLSRQGDILL
jgi:hypothetical protein